MLMEPDFNYLNKLIGKGIMALTEEAGTITPKQFGSQKKKSAIIHAINKQITPDIYSRRKETFASSSWMLKAATTELRRGLRHLQ